MSSECVSLALSIHHAKRMRLITFSFLACLTPPYFSTLYHERFVGRDSSVGTANRYELDGPGIESRWGRDFPHPSRPPLGPAPPPIEWLPGFSRG